MSNITQGNDLAVRTRDFALRIVELFSELPDTTAARVMGQQMLRSGTSVGAQYRESIRAKSRADFISKIEGALQELEETRYWLDLLVSSGLLASQRVRGLEQESDELIRMLVTSARTAKRNRS